MIRSRGILFTGHVPQLSHVRPGGPAAFPGRGFFLRRALLLPTAAPPLPSPQAPLTPAPRPRGHLCPQAHATSRGPDAWSRRVVPQEIPGTALENRSQGPHQQAAVMDHPLARLLVAGRGRGGGGKHTHTHSQNRPRHYTLIHTLTVAHSYTHAYSYHAHIHMHTPTSHTHMHMHTPTSHTHTLTHTHIHMHTPTSHTLTYTCTLLHHTHT